MVVRTVLLKKFFVWELNDFDPEALYNSTTLSSSTSDILPPLKVQAYDPYNNVNRKAVIKCSLWKQKNIVTANFVIRPDGDMHSTYAIVQMNEYCLLNDDETTRHPTYVQGKFSKVSYCIDLEVIVAVLRPFVEFPNGRFYITICKQYSLAKFVIKCQSESIEVYKAVLSYFSDVFKTMFGSNFKEAQQNYMEITDFGPEVVRKMVEFIETDTIANFDGYEEELLKIAHMYQIKDLMSCAVYEMACTITKENLYERLKMAKIYGLDKFKKWLIKASKTFH